MKAYAGSYLADHCSQHCYFRQRCGYRRDRKLFVPDADRDSRLWALSLGLRWALGWRSRRELHAYHSRLPLDEIPGLVATLFPDGRIERLNRQIVEFVGQPLAGMRDWADLIHRGRPAWFHAALAGSFDPGRGELLDCEVRVRHRDGIYRWFQARGKPLRDASGTIIRWYLLLVDIDDHKQMAEALSARERIYDSSSTASLPSFSRSTPSGEVEHVNQRIIDFFGLTCGELRDWSRGDPSGRYRPGRRHHRERHWRPERL